jgi:hypothetical protein
MMRPQNYFLFCGRKTTALSHIPVGPHQPGMAETNVIGDLMRFLFLLLSAVATVANAQIPDPSSPVGLRPIQAGIFSTTRVLWDKCGGEDQRACVPGDPSYRLLAEKLPGFTCDRALTLISAIPAIDGVPFQCVDRGGRSNLFIRSRLNAKLKAQQEDQLGRISADLPINLVPILGTHNSFSNAVDGATSQLSKNQEHSITDQLWLGARHIRMDPMADPIRQMLCHMSPGTSEKGIIKALRFFNSSVPDDDAGLCGLLFKPGSPGILEGQVSYHRPFYMALRELRRWLERNPGEVVFLLINNFWTTCTPSYLEPAEIEAVVRHELGDLMYPKPTGNPDMWPTIRQIRTDGKQVLVTWANLQKPNEKYEGTDTLCPPPAPIPADSWIWLNTLTPRTANSNSTSDFGFYNCQTILPATLSSFPIGISENNGHENPESIGEGRTVADYFEGAALISTFQMNYAVFCGFHRIGLDYFYALNKAPKSVIPSIDYRDGQKDDCFPCDDRPSLMIWSWQNFEQPSTGLPATLRTPLPPLNDGKPASLLDAQVYRWTQAGASTNLPYACASLSNPDLPFPNLDNPWNYYWTITSQIGIWSDGEAACQRLGANYHFWRPMSSPENRRLIEAMKVSGKQQVWLNHMPGQTVALPALPNAIFDSKANFTENVVLTSGFGGKITTSYIGTAGVPVFLSVQPARPGSNLYTISKAASIPGLSALANGTYSAIIRFTETRPDGQGVSTSDVTVRMTVSNAPVLKASPATLSFITGLSQNVLLESTDPSQSQLDFRIIPPASNWITVSPTQGRTPLSVSVTVNPALAPRVASESLTWETIGAATRSTVTVPASVSLVQATVRTSPVAIPVTIDTVPTTTPASLPWIAGSVHSLIAPTTHQIGGTTYTFLNWSDGVTVPNRNVISSADITYTANYTARHLLTVSVSPASSGHITIENPSQDGTYPSGTAVTIRAVPAPGYVFRQFAGDSSSQQSPIVVTMDAPKTIQARFVVAQPFTSFVTTPPGLPIVVDGVSYPTPAFFAWTPEETHVVTAPIPLATQAGTRHVFTNWADGNTANPRTFAGSTKETTHTAVFATQYLVTTTVSPAASGALSGSGWYAPGTTAIFQATPAAGFQFLSITGSVSSSTTSARAAVNGPMQVTANFTPLGRPVLYAASSSRTDLGNGVVAAPIVLTNLGTGPAADAKITSIDNLQVPQGGGTVTVTIPPAGIPLGTIPVSKNAIAIVNFNWPLTATRVTFTVRFSANGGAYTGFNTITLFRP